MLIGLSGYAQVGKDSLGRFLVEDHGYTRFAFADRLRSCLYALNPVVRIDVEGVPSRCQELVDQWGWEKAKLEFDEVRRLLQALGTEVGRNILGENVWVDATFNLIRVEGVEDVVITDVRFPNEAQEIKANGGIVVRVTRPGVTAINAHPSETSLDDWPFDLTVPNNASIETLRESVKWLAKEAPIVGKLGPTRSLPGYGSPTPPGSNMRYGV